MFDAFTVISAILVYVGLLFALAQWVERRARRGRHDMPALVYGLSLAVYCTTWTYYGSVGLAATSGLLFAAVYIGPTLAIALWWLILRRMAQVKESSHITSIADFISARYNRSQGVAALVTLMALTGILPYIALQLKAVVSTVAIITTPTTTQLDWDRTGLLVMLLMAAFTIIFGERRLDATERHQGVVAALAMECVVKLLAFVAVGLYATYGLFDGFQAIWQGLGQLEANPLARITPPDQQPALQWMTILVLSLFAIQLLPRQFHVAVVENANVRYIRTAMWVFPLYLLIMSACVLPIAGAGLVAGLPREQAEMFALLLPMQGDQGMLTLFAFIGGFSAATGMIIISTMTLSTMATNHLLIPLIERNRFLQPVRRYLLQCRWLVVLAILFFSYTFARTSEGFTLVNLGLLSFVAVAQFAPAALAALFWPQASRAGALLGLASGFLLWGYTLILPALITAGLIPPEIQENGPAGLTWLRPEALFGLDALPALTHSLFWSLLFNTLGLMVGSLLFPPQRHERAITREFMEASERVTQSRRFRPKGLRDYIDLQPKLNEARALLSQYLPAAKVQRVLNDISETLLEADKTHISVMELVEFHRMVERELTGAIGAAAAHRAMETGIRYNEREAADLQAIYSDILSELLTTPQELAQQAEYLPADAGGVQAPPQEMEAKIREREAEILQLKQQAAQLHHHQQTLASELEHERTRAGKLMRLLKKEINRRRRRSHTTESHHNPS